MKYSNIFLFLVCFIGLPTCFFDDPIQAMGKTLLYVVAMVSYMSFITGLAFWAIEHSRGE
ncbi:hypothetical protein AYO08_21840 [Pseudomonas putida]|nr:hypothetical protein AYO08_21840 [Pseudomonas putida]